MFFLSLKTGWWQSILINAVMVVIMKISICLCFLPNKNNNRYPLVMYHYLIFWGNIIKYVNYHLAGRNIFGDSLFVRKCHYRLQVTEQGLFSFNKFNIFSDIENIKFSVWKIFDGNITWQKFWVLHVWTKFLNPSNSSIGDVRC